MNLIFAFLLSVPFLNLLVGTFVGIAMAVKFISSREWTALFLGLGLASIWCLIGLVTLFGSGNYGFVSVTTVAWFVHFVFSYWMLQWADRVHLRKINAQMERLRSEYKGRADFQQVFGSNNGPYLTYDAQKKLFAFIFQDGFFVKPFDYVKEWELKWNTRISSSRPTFEDVRLSISTTDLDRSMIDVPMASKQHGDDLVAKLGILLT